MHPVIMRQLQPTTPGRCTPKQRMHAWPARRAGPGAEQCSRDRGFGRGRSVTTIPAWTQASGPAMHEQPSEPRLELATLVGSGADGPESSRP